MESKKRVMAQPPCEGSGCSRDAVKEMRKICATGGPHTLGGAPSRRVAAPARGGIWRPLASPVCTGAECTPSAPTPASAVAAPTPTPTRGRRRRRGGNGRDCGTLTEDMGHDDDAVEGLLSHGCGHEAISVPGGTVRTTQRQGVSWLPDVSL